MRILAIVSAFLLTALASGNTSPQSVDCYPITAEDLHKPDAPHFEQYPVFPERRAGPPAAVNLRSNAKARRFRTVLRNGAAEGPNFAGHFTIVGWGCGSSCLQFAVVDAHNGMVQFPPDFSVVSGVHIGTDNFEPTGSPFWGLRYRLDSSLLIVLGALDEDDNREGATYYHIKNGKLERLFSVYVRKHWCEQGQQN